jgi:hypothetical protein
MTTIFFHPSLLLLFLDRRSGMDKNQDPGKTSRIRSTADTFHKHILSISANLVCVYQNNLKSLRFGGRMHSFCSYFSLCKKYIHRPFIHKRSLSPSPYLNSCRLSGRNPTHGMPSRESNSGLPYSKPARYQLSHAPPRCSLELPVVWGGGGVATATWADREYLNYLKSRLSPFRRLSSRISSWQEELSKSSATLDEKGLQAELSQAIKTLQIKVQS